MLRLLWLADLGVIIDISALRCGGLNNSLDINTWPALQHRFWPTWRHCCCLDWRLLRHHDVVNVWEDASSSFCQGGAVGFPEPPSRPSPPIAHPSTHQSIRTNPPRIPAPNHAYVCHGWSDPVWPTNMTMFARTRSSNLEPPHPRNGVAKSRPKRRRRNHHCGVPHVRNARPLT